MLTTFRIVDHRVLSDTSEQANIRLYSRPDEAERRFLVEEYRIDEHTLHCALDADELSRLEFEPDHAAMILKIPKNYSATEPLLFRVNSLGVFLFKDKLVVVTNDDISLFSNKAFNKVASLNDTMLKLVFTTIVHFIEHLKTINMVSDDIEKKISTAMENHHLLSQFTLSKSLVFFQNAISSNNVLLEKIKLNVTKLNLTVEEVELLDDTLIENAQCFRQAQIYANILTSLMDAKASIISNNLNIVMKVLTSLTVLLSVPALFASFWGMNVSVPFSNSPFGFYIVLAMSVIIASIAFILLWRKKMF